MKVNLLNDAMTATTSRTRKPLSADKSLPSALESIASGHTQHNLYLKAESEAHGRAGNTVQRRWAARFGRE